jgi:hypothetical protein
MGAASPERVSTPTAAVLLSYVSKDGPVPRRVHGALA